MLALERKSKKEVSLLRKFDRPREDPTLPEKWAKVREVGKNGDLKDISVPERSQ